MNCHCLFVCQVKGKDIDPIRFCVSTRSPESLNIFGLELSLTFFPRESPPPLPTVHLSELFNANDQFLLAKIASCCCTIDLPKVPGRMSSPLIEALRGSSASL